MLIGLVKWFDNDKGFGVLGTPNDEEYFLHINSFLSKPEEVLKETPIAFSPKIDKYKDRKFAEASRLVGKPEDLKLIFSHLGNSDIVEIEFEVTRRGRLGRTYQGKEIHNYSLIGIALEYFFHDKSKDEISDSIIDYYDNDLDPKNFIIFCEVIDIYFPKYFSSDNATDILTRVFFHFGNNLNDDILFAVWKQKKFKFISYNENDDFEIPETVLRNHVFEIGKLELIRIFNFSYGADFCFFYARSKFINIESLSSSELFELYQFVEYEDEDGQVNRTKQLDTLYSKRIEFELIEETNQLGTIHTNVDLSKYTRLIQLIPNQLRDIDRIKITGAIHKIIAERCSDDFKIELWLKGIVEELPLHYFIKYFNDEDTKTDKRLECLIKLKTDMQFELLKHYSIDNTFEKGFMLIGRLVKLEYSLSNNFDITKVFFDDEFWRDKRCYELFELFTRYVNANSNDKQKLDLFLKGFLKNVSRNIIIDNIYLLEKGDFIKIFRNISEDKEFIKFILIKNFTPDRISCYLWLYDLAIEFLDQERFSLFDIEVFDTIDHPEYFKLWEAGKAKIFPQRQIEELLQDNFEVYANIHEWIINKAITSHEISEIFFSYLRKQILVTDRIVFYKQLNHIKFILQLNEFHLDRIKQFNNDTYNIFLWVLDKDIIFNYDSLKRKFIYFAPDDQVRIVRKLFFLKAMGHFDLTIEKLEELTRFDLDLYMTNIKVNPSIPIDISTDVVIKALSSYQRDKRFLVEG